MSLVVNGADQIATHFGTTVPHVLNVYSEYQAFTAHAWNEFVIAWVIVTIVASIIVGIVTYETASYKGAGDFFIGFLMGLMFVGLLGGMIAAAIYSASLGSNSIVIEYNIYYQWIQSVVGI